MLASDLRYAAWRARVRAAWKNRHVSLWLAPQLGCGEIGRRSIYRSLGCYGDFGVEGGRGAGGKTNLLLVVQALVVVLEHGLAFYLSGVGLGGRVCDVAGEDFLPEGEAAGGAWEDCQREIESREWIGCGGIAWGSAERERELRAGRAAGRWA